MARVRYVALSSPRIAFVTLFFSRPIIWLAATNNKPGPSESLKICERVGEVVIVQGLIKRKGEAIAPPKPSISDGPANAEIVNEVNWKRGFLWWELTGGGGGGSALHRRRGANATVAPPWRHLHRAAAAAALAEAEKKN